LFAEVKKALRNPSFRHTETLFVYAVVQRSRSMLKKQF